MKFFFPTYNFLTTLWHVKPFQQKEGKSVCKKNNVKMKKRGRAGVVSASDKFEHALMVLMYISGDAVRGNQASSSFVGALLAEVITERGPYNSEKRIYRVLS